MTADQAIKELEKQKALTQHCSIARTKAIQLGIEALKWLRQARNEKQISPKELLPGETES